MALIQAIQDGIPLSSRPYAEIGQRLGIPEAEVISRIGRLREMGIIKRFGVVVRHHELGFRYNAMVVWDVPDDQVQAVGRCIGQFDFVNLCYRRPRRLPHWRYNLFSMIHGRDRDDVLANIEHIIKSCRLEHIPHEALFSKRRFKQRGARYTQPQTALTDTRADLRQGQQH